jgi:hypothetical protein
VGLGGARWGSEGLGEARRVLLRMSQFLQRMSQCTAIGARGYIH